MKLYLCVREYVCVCFVIFCTVNCFHFTFACNNFIFVMSMLWSLIIEESQAQDFFFLINLACQYSLSKVQNKSINSPIFSSKLWFWGESVAIILWHLMHTACVRRRRIQLNIMQSTSSFLSYTINYIKF